ncbi:hypothetical protein LTR78_003968 [Recurvomyces mirabilis]|uniref:Uncharacterized protein n=1 Tax=Recurvomyces mirabilis TaxID=574656 RepID=A0AAE0WRB4_9PEZI|nr:hypothetical protein LTR78_003968 [Recurvomyces mirabilis]KAK5153894.1 hypothetical protein LTS14_007114 [Recurvomyces mirabilis]
MAGRAGAVVETRRPSFRKGLRDAEQLLPEEYLDQLEQKRKQLDESIHKYIASKEREYKQFERDLKHRSKTSGAATAVALATGAGNQSQVLEQSEGNGMLSLPKRRTSSESTQSTTTGSPFLAGQQNDAVNVLLSSGGRRVADAQVVDEEEPTERTALAGLQDTRSSEEREKELIGLFTPSYLPAIDHKDETPLELTESAPPDVEPLSEIATGPDATNPVPDASNPASLTRTPSDTAANPKVKRPAHLQLSSRTSSSGSSADGKLASAMKSPSHTAQRPKRKRVSLAVGDSIVAPSDNVPSALHISSTPSHSRTRSPDSDRAAGVPAGISATLDFAKKPLAASTTSLSTSTVGGASTVVSPPHPGAAGTVAATSPTIRNIDPDGDLFDLEDEAETPAHATMDASENALTDEDEESEAEGVSGRIATIPDHNGSALIPTTSPSASGNEKYAYDPEAGIVPEPSDTREPSWSAEQKETIDLDFGPGSSGFAANASQQPAVPGFRRPSVISDPKFRGADYSTEELKAATEEVYGSSYTRPTKGSFTGGSLGESYMAKHAEQMMQLRLEKREQDVR